MRFECSCSWQPTLIGEGHCSKHHTNYRVLNESGYLCFECELENKSKLTDEQLTELAELIRKS